VITFEGFSVRDGFGMINHTRTMGLVVFLHRSGATKLIETPFTFRVRTVLVITFDGFWVQDGFGTINHSIPLSLRRYEAHQNAIQEAIL